MVVAPEYFQAVLDRQVNVPHPAAEGGRSGDFAGSGAQGYWRKPDGAIVTGSYTGNGMRTQTAKGFLPLMQYGQFSLAYDSRRRWDPMMDPYRQILEQGGIKDFNAAQILEHHWHRKPHAVLQRAIDRLVSDGLPFAEAILKVMPQLEGLETQDVPCPSCPGRVFNSQLELEKHEILHKEDVQTRRLGSSISAALAGAGSANVEAMKPVLDVLVQAIQSLAVGQQETSAAIANTQALMAEVLKAQSGKR